VQDSKICGHIYALLLAVTCGTQETAGYLWRSDKTSVRGGAIAFFAIFSLILSIMLS